MNNSTAHNEPTNSEQPYFSAQGLSFLTCEAKRRVDRDTGKAPQRVNVQIGHMHREHSAYTNPTCALRAPFVSHTSHFCFDLCNAREVNAQTPNERSGHTPSFLEKLPTRTQCMRVTRH